jgi:hypothetical protein
MTGTAAGPSLTPRFGRSLKELGQSPLVFRAQRRRALRPRVGCRGLAEYRKTALTFFSAGQSSGSIKTDVQRSAHHVSGRAVR